MGFFKKTIKDIELHGKTVLMSVDYNVPGDELGRVLDDYRIKLSLPTLHYLLDEDCKIILISHRGRPEGKVVPKLSLRFVAKRLSQLLNKSVDFVSDCMGEMAAKAKKELKDGDIILLENTRFHAEEEKNDMHFSEELASCADVFVQDAFGNSHRSHASIVGVTQYLPSVAGLLLEKEVNQITEVMENPKRPLAAIVGGAKISDKITILERFIDIADFVAVGGAMANTFLLAEGIETGASLVEPDEVHLAKEIIEKAKRKSKKQHFIFYLPQDGVVAKKVDKNTSTRIVDWDAHVIATIENYPKHPRKNASRVEKDEKILDIGPFSGAFIAGGVQLANTVIWNGAMGVTEVPSISDPVGPFSHGTDVVVDALLGQFGHKPYTVVGGGDTVSYLQQRNDIEHFDHVSTGGGAGLKLIAGEKLPGLESLQNKPGVQ